MKILILGATGMLGSATLRYLSEDKALEVYATARDAGAKKYFAPTIAKNILTGIDVLDDAALEKVFASVKPDVVINCIGLVKQLAEANDPKLALPINAELPHRLAKMGARLIQIGTDCVFSGAKGNYTETDQPDATDLYGTSKLKGEVAAPHITLRTSIIGHELQGRRSLLEWFLAQRGTVKGFRRAIFSGLPTVELARVIREFVLPDKALQGLYHVAAEPIDKYTLLKLFADAYGKPITITPDDELVIDRSLNADKFRAATGYVAPPWPELVRRMASFR